MARLVRLEWRIELGVGLGVGLRVGLRATIWNRRHHWFHIEALAFIKHRVCEHRDRFTQLIASSLTTSFNATGLEPNQDA